MSTQIFHYEIVALKEDYDFRLLVDDAHGFGTMGSTGAGTGEHFGVMDGIDLYFGTFAKAMAGIGAFIACDEDVCDYLRYNMRSQIFAKSLPMPIIVGSLKRLELLRTQSSLREKLWEIVSYPFPNLRFYVIILIYPVNFLMVSKQECFQSVIVIKLVPFFRIRFHSF